MPPRVLILRAPGTNCDLETAHAFELAGAAVERWHINRLLQTADVLKSFEILCLPGGFSYGDDIAAGRILGNQIRHRLTAALQDFKQAGKLVLGICNGFQILLKSGLLLDEASDPPATLTWNASGKFEDRWIRVAPVPGKCVFFAGIESMYLPVAHAEGRFVTADQATLGQRGQIALVYRPLSGSQQANGDKPAALAYPENPNGSVANIAGVCDATGRVCGLMPHPERHIDPTHHPRWTRGEAGPVGDGLKVFQNAVGWFA